MFNINENDEIVISHSAKPDLAGDKYKIYTDREETALSNEFCKYFHAENIDTHEKFYAVVCYKFYLPNIFNMKTLQRAAHPNIVTPVHYSIVKMSYDAQEYFVYIVPYFNYKLTLQNYLNTHSLTPKQLNNKLLIPLMQIIDIASKSNIVLGNIDIDNIYFNENTNDFILRDPFYQPPYFSQQLSFLPNELISCHPAGRSTDHNLGDLYALGVTFFTALTNKEPYEKIFEDEQIRLRVNQGSYNALIGNTNISEDYKLLLKGLLSDSLTERWRVRSIEDWLNGKATKVSETNNIDTNTALSFNEKNFYNCKALAHEFYKEWDKAINFLKQEDLFKWIQRSIGRLDMVESLNEVINERLAASSNSAINKDKELFKVITTLDSNGPIRLKNFATNFSSLPMFLSYSVAHQSNALTHKVIELITNQFWRFNIIKTPRFANYNQYISRLETSSAYYNDNAFGFGIERIVYTLNPYLPCLSTNLNGHYVSDIKELLTVLDGIAEKEPDKAIMDEHIAGFIASKLNVKREIKVRALLNFPELIDNEAIRSLSILVLAHQSFPKLKIINIGKALSQKIAGLLDLIINSKNLRQHLNDSILECGESGNLAEILNIISNAKLIENDQKNFFRACKEVRFLNEQIKALSNKHNVKVVGKFYGSRITTLIAYLVLFISIITNYI